MRQNLLEELNAGCSALSWSTLDQKHFWGRNLDFNRLAAETKVTYVPRGTEYCFCGTSLENSENPQCKTTSLYASLGTGLLTEGCSPILYEGINEKGLMGGQLYYRGFAHFEDQVRPGTLPLQPPFLVYHMLSQCSSVDEVVTMLQNNLTLLNTPLFGTVPTLHWSFSDRSGESIVIEPDKTGISIYRNTIGVMTNSPGYSWHRLNLLNYAGIRDLDYDTLEIECDHLEQCFSGNGAQGLPGDFSSPSRFIRLAFLKKFCTKGSDEQDGIAKMFHLFQSAVFPLGMVRVSQPGHVTELDSDIVPFDYTIYTSIMCSESLRFYWTSYENQQIQYVDLNHLLSCTQPKQFDFQRTPQFICRS